MRAIAFARVPSAKRALVASAPILTAAMPTAVPPAKRTAKPPRWLKSNVFARKLRFWRSRSPTQFFKEADASRAIGDHASWSVDTAAARPFEQRTKIHKEIRYEREHQRTAAEKD